MHVCVKSLQLCLSLHDLMDQPTGSSVHGILQARTLEWVAMPFFRVSQYGFHIVTSEREPIVHFKKFLASFLFIFYSISQGKLKAAQGKSPYLIHQFIFSPFILILKEVNTYKGYKPSFLFYKHLRNQHIYLSSYLSLFYLY